MRRGIKSTLATATAVAAVTLSAGAGSANASPVTGSSAQQETAPGATHASQATPATISCAYGHFCGQDNNGRRFDVSKCGVTVPIGLSGPGEYFNNQTPETWAYWYDAGGNILGAANSGVSHYIDWTHVWYVKPC